jgi:hypothetical protein
MGHQVFFLSHPKDQVLDPPFKNSWIRLCNAQLLQLPGQYCVSTQTTYQNWLHREMDRCIFDQRQHLSCNSSRRLQQLFKYLHDIRLGAQMYNGWVTYDEQFRLRMAHNPPQDWDIMDYELWLTYITPTIERPTPSSPNKF